jgi:hypothetical protein
MLETTLTLAVIVTAAVLGLAACGGSDSSGDGGGSAAPVTVKFVGGQPEGGVQTIEAKKGETVHFTVESDQEGEAHLHGYDIEQEVAPGKPAVFDFEATIEGIFDLELHLDGDEAKIAELRVEP